MQITAPCDTCGRVEIGPTELTVHICAQNLSDVSFSFKCPECNMHNARSINRRIAVILLEEDCPRRYWNLPDELFEKKEGPPLNVTDMLDLQSDLQLL